MHRAAKLPRQPQHVIPNPRFVRRVRNLLFDASPSIHRVASSLRFTPSNESRELCLPTIQHQATNCHSERSGAAFSSSFARANEPRHAVEESLFDAWRSQVGSAHLASPCLASTIITYFLAWPPKLPTNPLTNPPLHHNIIPRPSKPPNPRILPKPSHLPLRIMPRPLLNQRPRLFHRHRPAQHRQHLPIPNEIKNLAILRNPRGNQTPHFLQPPARDHRLRTRRNPFDAATPAPASIQLSPPAIPATDSAPPGALP